MSSESYKQGLITPDRQVTVTWDLTEEIYTEPIYHHRRRGGELFPLATENVIKLKSNCWVLQPVNDLNVQHESEDAHQYTMRLSDFVAADVLSEAAFQRLYTELADIGADADVDDTGDYFITKRIAAGASWDNEILDIESRPLLPTSLYPMDRIARGPRSGFHPTDQGYIVKFILPGAPLQTPDWFAAIAFGGTIIGTTTAPHTGYGRFYLALSGDGRARLHEWIDDAWQEVNQWRFSRPPDVANSACVLRILPHAPNFIEFSFFTGGGGFSPLATPNEQAFAAARDAVGESGSSDVYVHMVEDRSTIGNGSAAYYPVTGAGNIAIDMRRDLRARFQVSRLQYPASGILVDRPFQLLENLSIDHVIRVVPIGFTTNIFLTAITGLEGRAEEHHTGGGGTSLVDADEELDFNGGTHTVHGQQPPASGKARARITLSNFELAGQRWHTPVLTAYEVARNGEKTTVIHGEKVGGTLRGVQIEGAGVQMEHERATLVIDDVSNELEFLRTRSGRSVLIETTYDPADLSKKSALFRGYVGRATATRMGKVGQEYPSPEWRRYQVECAGMWERLEGGFFEQLISFADDTTSPSGPSSTQKQPWKVTDAIRYICMLAGVPESQLDIFDDPLRLFPGPNQDDEVLTPNMSTTYREFIETLATLYFGAFFVADPSAGANGMFRLVRPPLGTETPLWDFTLDPPVGNALPHLSASYGANRSPVLLGDNAPPLNTYIIKPEANIIRVIGKPEPAKNGLETHQQILPPFNPISGPLDEIDKLPYLRPTLYKDPTLPDQNSVDWVARRLYQFVARGRKFTQFCAELVLVEPDDPLMTVRKRRPLRIGDMITIGGAEKWMVHSVTPSWHQSGMMTAMYECQLFREETTFAG